MSVPRRMRAAVLHGREDVRIEMVDVPRLEPGDVLLRPQAALTCGTDVKVFRRGYHARMIRPPAVFGHEAAGIVEAVGPGVEGVAPGDRVAVANSAPCGECPYCRRGTPSLCDDLVFWNGAYAELARIPARIVRQNLLLLEPGLEFRHAALVEPLACVVRGVEESWIGEGQSVVVLGAGPIGLMFVALARLRGARVTAVGRNAGRLARARALGAEETIVASPGADVAEVLRRAHGGEGADVAVEAVGLRETCEAAVMSVRKGGVVNLFAGCPADTRIAIDMQRMHYQELTVKSTFHHTPESIRKAFRLIAERRIDAGAFVTGEAPLERLPEVLRDLAHGGEGLKTAILPGLREGRK